MGASRCCLEAFWDNPRGIKLGFTPSIRLELVLLRRSRRHLRGYWVLSVRQLLLVFRKHGLLTLLEGLHYHSVTFNQIVRSSPNILLINYVDYSSGSISLLVMTHDARFVAVHALRCRVTIILSRMCTEFILSSWDLPINVHLSLFWNLCVNFLWVNFLYRHSLFMTFQRAESFVWLSTCDQKSALFDFSRRFFSASCCKFTFHLELLGHIVADLRRSNPGKLDTYWHYW